MPRSTRAAAGSPGDCSTPASSPARLYVDEIRRVQPTGPYHVVGYSFGGLVAYEMARQLEECGQALGLIGILDEPTPHVQSKRSMRPDRVFRNLVGNLGYWMSAFRALDRPQLRDRLLTRLRRSLDRAQRSDSFDAYIDGPATIPGLEHVASWPTFQRELVRANAVAASTYTPQPFYGDVTVFRARGRSLVDGYGRDLGWSPYVRGALNIRSVPGTHRRLLQAPYVTALAAQLQLSLPTVGPRRLPVPLPLELHPAGSVPRAA